MKSTKSIFEKNHSVSVSGEARPARSELRGGCRGGLGALLSTKCPPPPPLPPFKPFPPLENLPLLHLHLQATNETRAKHSADGTLRVRKVKTRKDHRMALVLLYYLCIAIYTIYTRVPYPTMQRPARSHAVYTADIHSTRTLRVLVRVCLKIYVGYCR